MSERETCEQAYKRGLEDGRKESAEALRAAEVVAKHHWDLYCQALANSMAWIPVTERLPEKGASALVYFDSGNMAVGFWFDKDEVVTFWSVWTDDGWTSDCDCEPTHWMPLPEPPKGE